MKFLLLFFYLVVISVAQGQFYQNQQQQSQYLSRQNSYGGISNLSYAVDLFTDQYNSKIYPNIGYNYTEKAKMYNVGTNEVEATVMIDNIMVQNMSYRGFEFKEELMPTDVNMKLEIWRAGQRLKSCDCSSRTVGGRQAGDFTCRYRDTARYTNYELRIIQLKFGFSFDAKSRLEGRINAVKNYSKSQELNQLWQSKLYSINTNNPNVDSLETYQSRLKDIEKEFNEWTNDNFWKDLDLQYGSNYNNDPARVNELKTKTDRDLKDKKREFELLDVAYLYAEKANYYYNKKQLSQAERYCRQAKQNKPEYAAANIVLAKIEIENKQWKAAAEYAQEACVRQTDCNKYPQWVNELQTLLQQIKTNYKYNSTQLLNKKDYENAAAQTSAWGRFCNNTNNCQSCNLSEINNFENQLSNEWQESYLQTATTEYKEATAKNNAKQWAQTERLLKSAWDNSKAAQQIAEKYKNTDKATQTMALKENILKLLFDNYIAWAEQQYTNKDYKAALLYCQTAVEYCQQFGTLSAYTQQALDLEKKIQKAIFQQTMQDWQNEERNNNLSIAFQTLLTAKELNDKYQFLNANESSQLNNKLLEIGSKDLIAQSDKIINNNELSNKDKLLFWKNLSKQQSKYKLQNQQNSQSLEKLQRHICDKVQTTELNEAANKIGDLVKSKDFIAAEKYLQQLQNISAEYKNLNCGFDNEYALSVAEEIAYCSKYQSAQSLAQSLENQGKYLEAIQSYEQANEWYKKELVNANFGNAQSNLVQYIIDKKIENYLADGCKHYLQTQKEIESLLLIAEYTNSKFNKKTSIDLQQQAANLSVKAHYNKSQKWKTVLQTVLQEKYKQRNWKPFRAEFKKAWRKQK